MKPYDFEANRDKLFDPFGKAVVTGLFEELSDPRIGGKYILFKLSDWKKAYLEISDPTEYEAAHLLIGSWKHWNLMLKNPVFRKCVEEWRNELSLKLEAEAFQNIREQAKLGNTTAAKFIAKHEYKEGVLKNKVGRPKKEDSEEIVDAVESEATKKVAEDMSRLGLKVLVGGK
jgi:hypothetical protein